MKELGLIKAEEVYKHLSLRCNDRSTLPPGENRCYLLSGTMEIRCDFKRCPVIASMQHTPAVEVSEVVRLLKRLQRHIPVKDSGFDEIGIKIKELEGIDA